MEQTNDRRKLQLTLATFFCYFYYFSQSVARSIFGTLTPFIVEHYGVSLTESSVFSMAESIGFIVIMLFVTVVADRIDKAWLLAVLGTIYAAILLVMGKGPGLALFVISLFITGMLGRYMDTTCTAYISDLYGENRSRFMSILLIIYYIGSTLAPNLNTFLIENRKLPWFTSYQVSGILMGVCTILCLIYLFTIKKPEVTFQRKKSKDGKRVSPLQLLKNRNILALFGNNVFTAIGMYFGSQLILYLSMLDPVVYDTQTRSNIATAGSLGLIVGSALYVWVSKTMPADKYLRIETLITFVFNVAGCLINKPTMWLILKFLSSAIGGGSFTARTLLCCEEYPEYSSTSIAMVSLASGITSTISTPLLNMLADATSFSFAMTVSMFFTLGAWAIMKFVFRSKSAEAV